MTDSRAFGIDQSRWDFTQADGTIISPDWPAIQAALNPTFAAARATVSWAYVDPVFKQLWPQMGQAKTPRFAYGVIYPDQPIKDQTDHFLATVADDWELAWPVQDAELDRGASVNQITDAILQWQVNIQLATGKLPLLYSRAGWIDQFTRNDGWRSLYLWWLANYLNDATKEHPGPPTFPAGVDTYLVHQTCQKYPVPAGVTARTYTDSDRWNGPVEEVHEFFGLTTEEPPSDPIAILTARMDALEKQHLADIASTEKVFDEMQKRVNDQLAVQDTNLAAAVERVAELERWRKS